MGNVGTRMLVRLVRLVLQGLQRMLVRLAQWMQLDTRRIDMVMLGRSSEGCRGAPTVLSRRMGSRSKCRSYQCAGAA